MKLARTRKPVRRNETRDLTHPIRVALNKLPGVRVARNNVGSLEWAPGKMLRYGLGEGSADLVGIVRMTVRPSPFDHKSWCDCIGEHGPCNCEGGPPTIGRAFALEVKWPGEKPTGDQLRWMSEVRKLGGFSCVVHSVDEAVQAVERCRRGESQ